MENRDVMLNGRPAGFEHLHFVSVLESGKDPEINSG